MPRKRLLGSRRMNEDRHSQADPVELISDPDGKARREAENGVRQFKAALEIVRSSIRQLEQKFRLTQAVILTLHHKALDGIHPLAGTYRNSAVYIGKSNHFPPRHVEVPDLVAEMCAYVNERWEDRSAIHLAAYVLWRMNWIHPFADGNGRTARATAYVVLSAKLDSLLPGTPTIPDQIAADKLHTTKHWKMLTIHGSAISWLWPIWRRCWKKCWRGSFSTPPKRPPPNWPLSWCIAVFVRSLVLASSTGVFAPPLPCRSAPLPFRSILLPELSHS